MQRVPPRAAALLHYCFCTSSLQSTMLSSVVYQIDSLLRITNDDTSNNSKSTTNRTCCYSCSTSNSSSSTRHNRHLYNTCRDCLCSIGSLSSTRSTNILHHMFKFTQNEVYNGHVHNQTNKERKTNLSKSKSTDSANKNPESRKQAMLSRDWSSFDSETDSGFDTSDEGVNEEPFHKLSMQQEVKPNRSNNSVLPLLNDWQSDDLDEEVSRILCSELKTEFRRQLSPWNSAFDTNDFSPVQFDHRPPDHVIRPTLVR